MQTEIILAGFGGQGVLFAGQMLAFAAMDIGKEVTWFPSYGPEMRGGTANCTVIIADQEIGSPLVRNPQAAIVMNLPSLDKYEPLVKSGGVLIANTSLINRGFFRSGIDFVGIPASELAESIGEKQLANMIMVGKLLERLPVLPLEAVENSIEQHLPPERKHLVEPNLQALRLGWAYAQSELAAT